MVLTRYKTAEKLRRFIWALARGVLLFCIGIIILYPLLYMLVLALRPADQIWDPTVVWISKSLTLINITNVIEYMDYWSALGTTARITLLSALLTVISCSLCGYGFARYQFRFKELLFLCVIFTVLVPAQNIIFPSFLNFWKFDFFGLGYLAYPFTGNALTVNLLDSELTLYIPAAFGSGIKAGLCIYIFRQFYRGLPKEMEEAASIDGCGAFATFIRIALPSSIITLITVFLFSLVWYWNDYYFTSMYMDNVNTVSSAVASLPALLNSLSSIGGEKLSYDSVQVSAMIQSGCLLLVLPPLIVFTCLQRYFIQGLEMSGLVE